MDGDELLEEPQGQAIPDRQLSAAEFSGGELIDDQTQGPPSPAATTPPTPQTLSVRDVLGTLGVQLGADINDDYNALVYLARQAQEAERLRTGNRDNDVLAQLGRQLAPRAQELLQPGTRQAAPQRKPYEPPQVDDRWMRLLQVDEASGRYVAKHSSVPAAIVNAANDYADYTQNFLRNPVTVIRQVFEDMFSERAPQFQQTAQEAVAGYQRQQQVRSIVQSNADWAYSRDAAGNFLADPVNGGYHISPLGQQYLGLVQRAAAMGIADPVMRDEFARTALRPEIAAALQAQSVQPDTPNTQVAARRQQPALRQSRPRVSPLLALGQQQRQQDPAASPDEGRTLSLMEEMRRRMMEEGITDDQLRSADAFSAR